MVDMWKCKKIIAGHVFVQILSAGVRNFEEIPSPQLVILGYYVIQTNVFTVGAKK
jgi:hypothetical protein